MAGAGRTQQGRRIERRGSHVDEPAAGSSHIPRLVDITTIAAHLDVSVRHVRRLVAERRIPYVKWGNRCASIRSPLQIGLARAQGDPTG